MSSYMIKPKVTTCSECGKADDPTNMIQTVQMVPGQKDPVHGVSCQVCWHSRGRVEPQEPVREAPRPKDPRSAFAATSHKTIEQAIERAAKVAHVIGVLPEITPRDPKSAGPFFVAPDSPLVEGYKAAKNPYA
jgi:hypothetical protein